jgi:hypothetical protein
MLESLYENLVKNPGGFFVQYPDGQLSGNIVVKQSGLHIIPGSFNPLHAGHHRLHFYAAQVGGGNASYFEISIANRAKPTLSVEELQARLQQFRWRAPIIVTNSPYFHQKIATLSQLSVPISFHTGHDTMSRILSDHTLTEIESYPCNFYVYDRGCPTTGNVLTIADLPYVPKNVQRIDHKMDNETLFLSSTKLRSASQC